MNKRCTKGTKKRYKKPELRKVTVDNIVAKAGIGPCGGVPAQACDEIVTQLVGCGSTPN